MGALAVSCVPASAACATTAAGMQAMEEGMSDEQVHEYTNIDPWFLAQMRGLHDAETWLRAQSLDSLTPDDWRARSGGSATPSSPPSWVHHPRCCCTAPAPEPSAAHWSWQRCLTPAAAMWQYLSAVSDVRLGTRDAITRQRGEVTASAADCKQLAAGHAACKLPASTAAEGKVGACLRGNP